MSHSNTSDIAFKINEITNNAEKVQKFTVNKTNDWTTQRTTENMFLRRIYPAQCMTHVNTAFCRYFYFLISYLRSFFFWSLYCVPFFGLRLVITLWYLLNFLAISG
jgi:hypothetical protein